MSFPIHIRLASSQDVNGILDIYAYYILHTDTTYELEIPSIETFDKRISKYLQTAPWLVAVSDDMVIGYAYASPHRERPAYQWSIEVSTYIHNDFQGKKIGSRLYACLLDLLREQRFCTVLAGIVQPNIASNKFHRSFGFQFVGTYPNIGYKLGKWSDVTWMSLSLQRHLSDHPEKLRSLKEITESGQLRRIIDRHNS